MSPICPSCGTPCQDGQNFCPNCGAKLSGALPIQHDSPPDPYGQWIYQTPEYGMGPGQNMAWFKFIIYFQLFCTAIVGCLSGIVAFFGSQYDILRKILCTDLHTWGLWIRYMERHALSWAPLPWWCAPNWCISNVERRGITFVYAGALWRPVCFTLPRSTLQPQA